MCLNTLKYVRNRISVTNYVLSKSWKYPSRGIMNESLFYILIGHLFCNSYF